MKSLVNALLCLSIMAALFTSCSKEQDDIVNEQQIESQHELKNRDNSLGATEGGDQNTLNNDDPCNCNHLYDQFLTYQFNCLVLLNQQACDLMEIARVAYNNCDASEPLCPPGYVFNGVDCYNPSVHLPTAYEGFVWDNKYYVTANTSDPNTDEFGCPAGWVWNGHSCRYTGAQGTDDHPAFIYGDGLYVEAGPCCRSANVQCPEGFTEEGAYCHSGVSVYDNYQGFAWGQNFYVHARPKDLNADADGCPPGYFYNGADCQLRNVSYGSEYVGLVVNGEFVVQAIKVCED